MIGYVNIWTQPSKFSLPKVLNGHKRERYFHNNNKFSTTHSENISTYITLAK